MASLASLLLLSSCSDSVSPWTPPDPCSLDEDGVIWGIGPAGGKEVFSEPGHPMDGLTIRIPAGAWTECWSVMITEQRLSSGSPRYHEGFLPFESPSFGEHFVSVLIEQAVFEGDRYMGNRLAPPSMYMEILFPLRSIPEDAASIYSAFQLDAEDTDWNVKLPEKLDNGMLTVTTTEWDAA